jgi:hypothetical protein
MLKPNRKKRLLKNNPWEILVVGAAFFFPGLFMLFHHGPLVGVQQGYRYTYMAPSMSAVTAISEHGAHVFGGLAVAVGVVFFWFYFYLRRLIARSTPYIVEHGHEHI